MSKDAASSTSRTIKDGSASGGLLSKASNSLRRSPSKKHKYQSNPLPSLDRIFHETHKSGSSELHPLPQKRPDVYRTQTAPLALHPSKASLKEGKIPQSAVEGTMLVTSFTSGHRRDTPPHLSKSTIAGPQNGEHVHVAGSAGDALPPAPAHVAGNQNSDILYQHIYDMASKRISTLDYFRKAHEGRVFWFNTVHFSRTDLSKWPNFTAAKLSRRATNYLLLGLSIPPILDVHPQNNSAASAAANATAAYDFLKALYALLGEFESYQQIHPSDGSTASSLSRSRIPHMFKRATHATTSRSRRTSSSAGPEIGLPLQQSSASHSSDPQRHHHHHHGSNSSSAGTPLDSNNSNSNNNTITALHPNPSSTNLSLTAPSSSQPTPATTTNSTNTAPPTLRPPAAHSSIPTPTTNPRPDLNLPNSTLTRPKDYTHSRRPSSPQISHCSPPSATC
ncbi:hypothetical protein GJ744_007411 [Endocarpon pusillum]|uniref:Uncharacterized protein n=1 Tax=Endocarpon pusillum TaxID=364733 RepID=A0A8H7ARN2_9EURO|nr:hypothetical protein GJ744_007411 [Endocarpon pusillum]